METKPTDAERLDWLSVDGHSASTGYYEAYASDQLMGTVCVAPTVREAIDAAMQAQPKP